MDNRDIIKLCKKNNRKAQRRFVDIYSNYIYSICLRYINDANKAKDLTQDSLVQILNNIDKYEEKGVLQNWIATVTVRVCLDYLKINAKHTYAEINGKGINAKDDVLANLNFDDLISMLNKLPERYRIAFNMFSIEGYSHREIGEYLNITESSSRSIVSRARMMMQDQIKNEEKRLGLFISNKNKLKII